MTRPTSIFNHDAAADYAAKMPITDGDEDTKLTKYNDSKGLTTTKAPVNQQLALITEDYIMNIGTASAKGLTDLTSKILSAASANSGGEMGSKLDELIDTTKSMSIDNFKANPLMKLVNKALRMKDHAMENFQTANDRVNILVTQLQKERNGQDNDRKSLDALAQQNYEYCKSVIVEIDNAKDNLELMADALGQFPDTLDYEAGKQKDDLQTRYDMLEKKIVDLEANKILSMNMEPKLKLMKQGAISLIGTFDNIVIRIVPLYMQQFSAYLIGLRGEQAAAVSDKAITMFNQTIMAGSDLAAKNAESMARVSQRQMIDVETLKHDHENVVSSLDKVKQIAIEARANRKTIMAEIQSMEQQTITAFSKPTN